MNMEAVEYDRLFLNEDVLINVLLRLSVKTLLRFRCVCKRWCYLISHDPYFCRLHSDHQSKSKQSHLLFSSTTAKAFRPSSDYPLSPESREKILSSTHPISLETMDREGNSISRFEVRYKEIYSRMLPTRLDLVCINDNEVIHICNPSTHEFITLPDTPSHDTESFVGFGYAQSTEEYKVVQLISPDFELDDEFIVDAASLITKCHVFTFGMGIKSSPSWAWRNVVYPLPYHIGFRGHPAFVNETIHWLVHYDSMVDNEVYHGNMIDPNKTIIAFDIKSEEFRLVPHPGGCPDLRSFKFDEHQLVELRGLLCLSFTKFNKMDIWMLKDYQCESDKDHISGSWVKEYNIDLDILPPSYQMGEGQCRHYVPRDIEDAEDTKLLIETLFIGMGYYNLRNTSFKGFMHRTQTPVLQLSFYVESLRSLKKMKTIGENIEAEAEAKQKLENKLLGALTRPVEQSS